MFQTPPDQKAPPACVDLDLDRRARRRCRVASGPGSFSARHSRRAPGLMGFGPPASERARVQARDVRVRGGDARGAPPRRRGRPRADPRRGGAAPSPPRPRLARRLRQPRRGRLRPVPALPLPRVRAPARHAQVRRLRRRRRRPGDRRAGRDDRARRILPILPADPPPPSRGPTASSRRAAAEEEAPLLASGPHALIWAHVAPFRRDVPSAYHFTVFGVRFSDKAFVYLAAIQLALSRWPSERRAQPHRTHRRLRAGPPKKSTTARVCFARWSVTTSTGSASPTPLRWVDDWTPPVFVRRFIRATVGRALEGAAARSDSEEASSGTRDPSSRGVRVRDRPRRDASVRSFAFGPRRSGGGGAPGGGVEG